MSLRYTRQKLYSAVRTLASSNESIQDRLYFASSDLMTLHQPDDFPEELREEFNEIHQKLTHEGSFEATTTKMSEEEARKIAEKIVDLYDEIAQKLGAMESQTILSV
ncbi:hypothetical protein AA650_24525 [Anabaena sp. WA102]|jgi:hypothetical protein|uniref:hypothetical protein n=1 Tax=Anabaena sp. WA102 TaxID=1647413 RepID=UPI0006AC74D0|nr:hypothetical protein [Anabaena sp. WA102]ALB43192.1 hypothetical protein AA650_24525 [Anabaena sp. WA102]